MEEIARGLFVLHQLVLGWLVGWSVTWAPFLQGPWGTYSSLEDPALSFTHPPPLRGQSGGSRALVGTGPSCGQLSQGPRLASGSLQSSLLLPNTDVLVAAGLCRRGGRGQAGPRPGRADALTMSSSTGVPPGAASASLSGALATDRGQAIPRDKWDKLPPTFPRCPHFLP